ncbi:MAG: IS1380 family transposase [Planctomycetota bacterium]
MSQSKARREAKCKKRIGRRLRRRNYADQPRPMFAASNIQYDQSDRMQGLAAGGIGAIHLMVRRIGLIDAIDESLHLLKAHVPYHESDHVLNIAYNSLLGGTCLEDIELRRNDEVYLNALGAVTIPDPTTAGDFCRRFAEPELEVLQKVINRRRLQVWRRQPDPFFEEAIVEADGTMAPTTGECKEGMDISHNGVWGYHPLLMSLANTSEPLYLVNRSGSRPSHEGAAARFDQALALCREAGFRRILFRGDTDFSQTKHLDGWDGQGVRFIFGMDASPVLVDLAEALPAWRWSRLERAARYRLRTRPRRRPERIKEGIVREREFENIRLLSEDVAYFPYQPYACEKAYRIVVVRKNLTVEKGNLALFDDVRYFFYITNDWRATPDELVFLANDRCDQENLIDQLKNGVKALRMPVDNLKSNWAYMIMASLAWTLKAWFALLLPETGRWRTKYQEEKRRLLRMEFRGFVNAMIQMPVQVVRAGRRIIFRLLSWNPWQHVLLRAVDHLYTIRC